MRRHLAALAALAVLVTPSRAPAGPIPDPPHSAEQAGRDFAERHASRQFDAATAGERPEFVLNRWGGIVRCSLASSLREAMWCEGIYVPAADPRRFDCREAEVTAEYDFCRIPYPTRRK